MLVTLVRHAEVDEAYHKCYNGHIDIGLSAKGKKEAEELALCLKDKAFNGIFCSDLKRCKETLEAFNLDLKPTYTSMLREKSWGRHEGKNFKEIISMEDFKYENFEQWINALDGEAYPSYVKRIEDFFKGFLPASTCQNVLVMTHAGVIRVLMHLLQDISLEEAFSKPFGYAQYICLDTDTWEFQDLT
ncbi:MAG TPA: histidine phosphatase family protein [Sulfurimonas sp.]|nr:histidine phosphatase family protein [Sulfurimonas sp.]